METVEDPGIFRSSRNHRRSGRQEPAVDAFGSAGLLEFSDEQFDKLRRRHAEEQRVEFAVDADALEVIRQSGKRHNGTA